MAEKEQFGISEQLDATEQQKSTEQPSATDTNVATTDTISRQAAVSGISDLLMLELKGERLPTYNEVYRAIYDLPSAQPWIPCKTAFPEKENTRVTYQTNAGMIIYDGIYGGIDAYGHRVWLDRERGLYWDDEVVAWMPVVIPEPWKGEQDG